MTNLSLRAPCFLLCLICRPGGPRRREAVPGPDRSEKIAIFGTRQAAASALDNIQSRADCAVKVVNEGKVDTADAHFSDASFSPLSFPSHGDSSRAYRLELKAQAKGQTGIGSQGRV